MIIPKSTIPENKINKWSIVKFTVSKDDAFFFNIRARGRGIREGEYTKLVCEGRGIIMSDTPAEMSDHYSAVRNAKGHCLINGLGLGMVAIACLNKPEVTKVTIIEMEQDVIDLVSPFLQKQYGDKVEIIHKSAFEYIPPTGIRYGMVWHDIWDDICTDNWEEYKKLNRKYGRKTEWQGSWAKPELLTRLRQEKNFYSYWN